MPKQLRNRDLSPFDDYQADVHVPREHDARKRGVVSLVIRCAAPSKTFMTDVMNRL